MSLGKRIRQRRLSLNVTQQQLAQALGVTPQHISLIEQEKAAPSLALLPSLARELGVTTDYLIAGDDCVITDVISAIKGDNTLSLKAKRLLISMVEELRRASTPESTIE